MSAETGANCGQSGWQTSSISCGCCGSEVLYDSVGHVSKFSETLKPCSAPIKGPKPGPIRSLWLAMHVYYFNLKHSTTQMRMFAI